jgi:hypothetical protein
MNGKQNTPGYDAGMYWVSSRVNHSVRSLMRAVLTRWHNRIH